MINKPKKQPKEKSREAAPTVPQSSEQKREYQWRLIVTIGKRYGGTGINQSATN